MKLIKWKFTITDGSAKWDFWVPLSWDFTIHRVERIIKNTLAVFNWNEVWIVRPCFELYSLCEWKLHWIYYRIVTWFYKRRR